MSFTLDVLSPSEIEAERARLIESTNMTLEELHHRARSYALTPYEQGVLDQIQDLDYLSETT